MSLDELDRIIVDIKSSSVNEAKRKLLKVVTDSYSKGYVDAGIFYLTEESK